MKTWLITDTHFNHKNMIDYCGRPENFDDLIWKGLWELPDDSILIHLGDICIGGDKEVHEKIKLLPYKKILVKGNHDKKSNTWYLQNGWDFVCDSLSDNYFGRYITFSHIPIAGIQNLNIHGHFHNHLFRLQQGNWIVEGEEERNKEVLKILTNNHKLLAIENTKYKPVLLETLLTPSPQTK